MNRIRILFKSGQERTIYTNRFQMMLQTDSDGTPIPDTDFASYAKRERGESLLHLNLDDVSCILSKPAEDDELRKHDKE